MFAELLRKLAEIGTVTFDVRVRAGAPQTVVTRILSDGTVKISVAAAPEDGKANEELVRYLAEEFSVPRANVTLLAGHASRRKLVRVSQ